MTVTRDDLVGFLEKELGLDVATIDDETPLFSAGIIDSFMLVSLMGFLEKRGGFRIPQAEVTLDNLDSVGRLLAFADRMSG